MVVQVSLDLMQYGFKRRDPMTTVSAGLSTRSVGFRLQITLPLCLAALGLALRLHGLTDKPFWYDEILTWGRARLPLGELLINALKHKHFPTYFLVVGPFAAAAHDPEWMLRLPSVVFGAGCVFLVARLATDARGLAAGLVAGLLMALSPIEVAFAQDARPYTLISCLVLIAAWGLLRIAQNPKAAALSMRQPAGLRGAWLGYVLGTLGAVLVENNTVPWLIASNLAIALIVVAAVSERRGLIRNWAWSQAIIILVWLPALLAMWSMNRGAMLDGMQWIPKVSWDSVRTTAAALYLFRVPELMTLKLFASPLPEFGALVALAAAVGVWRLRDDLNVLAVIGLAFLAMPLAIMALTPFQPLLVPRYLLWSTGPFFVLAGIGTATLPARLFAPAVLAVALGGAVSLAPYYGAETKPRWDEALSYLAARARPGDVVVAENETVEYFVASYAGRFGLPPQTPILSWNPHDPRPTVRRAVAAERAWIVYGRVGQGPQEPEADFRRKWSDLGAPAEQIRFGASILILRFDRPAPSQPSHDVGLEHQEATKPSAVSAPNR